MKETVSELDAEQFHHVVLMENLSNDEYPLGIAFSDENNVVQCFVPLDLHTANEIGEKFCQKYNEALQRIRKDV